MKVTQHIVNHSMWNMTSVAVAGIPPYTVPAGGERAFLKGGGVLKENIVKFLSVSPDYYYRN